MAKRTTPRGDEAELFAEHHDRLVATVARKINTSRANIEDACSFAWMQLMQHDPGRDFPVLKWLTVVAAREALRLHRKESRSAELTDLRLGYAGDRQADLDTATDARDALRALADLPPRQRDLMSRKIAGYSYDEIGEQTGDTFRTVERQLVRARRRLKEAS